MASSEYEIDARVGCKILVHSIKNKTKDVCGLLLGNVESGGRVRVTDAIPLFHHHVLSPGLEFAIENVRARRIRRKRSRARAKGVFG